MATTPTIDRRCFAFFARTAMHSLRPAAVPTKAELRKLRVVLQRSIATASDITCYLPSLGVSQSLALAETANQSFQRTRKQPRAAEFARSAALEIRAICPCGCLHHQVGRRSSLCGA